MEISHMPTIRELDEHDHVRVSFYDFLQKRVVFDIRCANVGEENSHMRGRYCIRINVIGGNIESPVADKVGFDPGNVQTHDGKICQSQPPATSPNGPSQT